MSKNSGRLIEHEDGRKGIAYQRDQSPKFASQNKVVCRFFTDNDMKKKLQDQKVAVKFEKIKVQGFVD